MLRDDGVPDVMQPVMTDAPFFSVCGQGSGRGALMDHGGTVDLRA